MLPGNDGPRDKENCLLWKLEVGLLQVHYSSKMDELLHQSQYQVRLIQGTFNDTMVLYHNRLLNIIYFYYTEVELISLMDRNGIGVSLSRFIVPTAIDTYFSQT